MPSLPVFINSRIIPNIISISEFCLIYICFPFSGSGAMLSKFGVKVSYRVVSSFVPNLCIVSYFSFMQDRSVSLSPNGSDLVLGDLFSVSFEILLQLVLLVNSNTICFEVLLLAPLLI